MFFLLFLFSLLVQGGEPGVLVDMELTVTGNQGNIIFVNTPRVTANNKLYQSTELQFLITTYAVLHRTTFTPDNYKISNVYNKDTAKIYDEDCNWETDSQKCAIENGMYIIDSQVIINPVRAYISMTLYSSEMIAISGATVSNKHQRQVIQLTQQKQSQGLLGSVKTTEQQKPEIFSIEPYVYNKDFRQAIMLLYMSIK